MDLLKEIRRILCKDRDAKIESLVYANNDLVVANYELSSRINMMENMLANIEGKARQIVECENYLRAHRFVFKDKRDISGTESRNIIRNATKATGIHMADNMYRTVDIDEMREFLMLDKTNVDKMYVTEWFDCDDFSFRLKGNISTQHNADIAMFIVWSSTHAFNAFIDNDKKLWYIEPQTDIIIDPATVTHPMYKDIRLVIG